MVNTVPEPEFIIIYDQYGNSWHVDKQDKLWPEVLAQHKAGEVPIRLPLNYITENRGWGWWTAFEKQVEWISNLNLQEVNQEQLKGFEEAGVDELTKALQWYGSWLGYLEAQVGVLLGRHVALKEGYESGLNVAMASLESGTAKTIKEKEGYVLASNVLLRQARYQLIETEVLLETARKHRDAFKTWWDTLSRIISVRLGEMNFASRDQSA